MSEVKLTKQSEAILLQLRKDVSEHRLSREQYDFVESCLRMKTSLGYVGNVIVKAALILASLSAIWSYVPWGGSK